MADYIEALARNAWHLVHKGYYKAVEPQGSKSKDLIQGISECRGAALITEIKLASPSHGLIRCSVDVSSIARAMEKGGAVGISVLTEPNHFKGSLRILERVRREVEVPLLMKDVVVSKVQLEAAERVGADAVLLISSIFRRGFAESDMEDMVEEAHSRGLQVILESHGVDEFHAALETKADLLGINNRNLTDLSLDLAVTERVLEGVDPDRPVISESGIRGEEDIRRLKRAGADAFLVGTAVVEAPDVEARVRELVAAL